MQANFNPNEITFDQGLEHMQAVASKVGLEQKSIHTSRDAKVREAVKLLRVENVPDGFQKWQLPVYLDEPSQLYFTVAQAGMEVPEHSHDEGDGIRFIISGSIHHKDLELTAGDWMFVPAGVAYSFRVGDLGAVMCYCYCCSCAGKIDIERGDPAPFEQRQ